MKFRALFIPTLFFLNSFTSANALSNAEVNVVNTTFQSLVSSPGNFASIASATTAINTAIAAINSSVDISNSEKNNAVQLLVSQLKQTNTDPSILNAAISASNATTAAKAALLNATKDTPDGAKPITNSP